MPRRRTRSRRRYHRNPSVRGMMAGLSFQAALKTMWMFQLGMFISKWAAKRLPWGGEATETDPASWEAPNYIKGALGGVGGAMLANALKPGSGQRVLEGALNLLVFKLVENELVPRSELATAQIGGYPSLGAAVVMDETGAPAMLGEGGEMIPLDESHRAQEYLPVEGYGDALEPVGRLGDELVSPGRLGQVNTDMMSRYYAAYSR